MLDYIITRHQDLSEILDTRAMRCADCWTDHVLLRCKAHFAVHKLVRKKSSLSRESLTCHGLSAQAFRANCKRSCVSCYLPCPWILTQRSMLGLCSAMQCSQPLRQLWVSANANTKTGMTKMTRIFSRWYRRSALLMLPGWVTRTLHPSTPTSNNYAGRCKAARGSWRMLGGQIKLKPTDNPNHPIKKSLTQSTIVIRQLL